MTIRKRKNPTPHFGLPPPYSPVTGQEATLSSRGVYPFVAMMQVAATDTHQNYVICRGHDVRFSRFYDYAAGDATKPGIPVAKPYGRRRPCLYRVGQIFPAIIPLQTPNPQPASVPWRVGANPGVSSVSDGHPADLSEEVDFLYDDNGVLIDYMFLEGETQQDMIVRAVGCILPGEGGSVRAQQWNSSTQCWEDDSYDPFTIIDPMGWLLAVDGDCFKIEAHQGGCGESLGGDYMPAFPFGMKQLVRVLTKIDCGKCGEVTIVRKSDEVTEEHCSTFETECKFTACNMSYRPISCDAQEYAWADVIPGHCCLPDVVEGSDGPEPRCIAFLTPFPRPMFAKGTLTEDLCGGAASLTDSAILDACAASDFEPPTAAENSAKLHACSGTDVLALFKVTSDEGGQGCAWDIIAVQDAELPDWVVDLKCGTGDDACTVQKKIKGEKRYGHYCVCTGEEDDWVATELVGTKLEIPMGIGVDEASSQQVLTDAACGSCSFTFGKATNTSHYLKLTTKKVCVFCADETLEDGEDISIDEWEFLTLGAPEDAIVIEGDSIDVVTDLKVQSEVTSEGGGEEVDCEAGIEGTLNLMITGKTKTICAFCSADSEGVFTDGADAPLSALKLSSESVLTDAVFDCSGCPTFTPSYKVLWAFCVDAEDTVGDVQLCECDPCVEESA